MEPMTFDQIFEDAKSIPIDHSRTYTLSQPARPGQLSHLTAKLTNWAADGTVFSGYRNELKVIVSHYVLK